MHRLMSLHERGDFISFASVSQVRQTITNIPVLILPVDQDFSPAGMYDIEQGQHNNSCRLFTEDE